MNGCHYCDEFDPMWKKLKKNVNGVKMKKINKDNCPELLQKFNVSSFPSLILDGNSFEKFDQERTIPNIKQFLQKFNMI